MAPPYSSHKIMAQKPYIFSSRVGSLCHTHGIVRHQIHGSNVHHVPGLCLLGIGSAPTLATKLWLGNRIFTFLTSSLKPPADGA